MYRVAFKTSRSYPRPRLPPLLLEPPRDPPRFMELELPLDEGREKLGLEGLEDLLTEFRGRVDRLIEVLGRVFRTAGLEDLFTELRGLVDRTELRF